MKRTTYRELTREQKLSIAERDYSKAAGHVNRHKFLKENIPFLAGMYRGMNTLFNRPAYRSAEDYNMMEAVDTWQRVKDDRKNNVAGLQEDIDAVVGLVRKKMKVALARKTKDNPVPAEHDVEALQSLWQLLAKGNCDQDDMNALALFWRKDGLRDYLAEAAAQGLDKDALQNDLYKQAHHLNSAFFSLGYASINFDKDATELGLIFDRNKVPLAKLHDATDEKEILNILKAEKVRRAYRDVWDMSAPAVTPEAKWQASVDAKAGITHLDDPLPEVVPLYRHVMNHVAAMKPTAWIKTQWGALGNAAQKVKDKIGLSKNTTDEKADAEKKKDRKSVFSGIKMPPKLTSFAKRIKFHHVGLTGLAVGLLGWGMSSLKGEKKAEYDDHVSPYAVMHDADSVADREMDSAYAADIGYELIDEGDTTSHYVQEDVPNFVPEKDKNKKVENNASTLDRFYNRKFGVTDDENTLASFYQNDNYETRPAASTKPSADLTEEQTYQVDNRFQESGMNHATMMSILQDGHTGNDRDIDFSAQKTYTPVAPSKENTVLPDDAYYFEDDDISENLKPLYFAASAQSEKMSEATLVASKTRPVLVTPYAMRLARFELACLIMEKKDHDPLLLREAEGALKNSTAYASDNVLLSAERDVHYAYESIMRAQHYMTGKSALPKNVGYGELAQYVATTSDVMVRENRLQKQSTEYQRVKVLADRLAQTEQRARSNRQMSRSVDELQIAAGALGVTVDINTLAEQGRTRAMRYNILKRYAVNDERTSSFGNADAFYHTAQDVFTSGNMTASWPVTSVAYNGKKMTLAL